MIGKVTKLAAAAALAVAAFAVPGPAFAAGPNTPGSADSALGALAGTELSPAQLGATRGQGAVNLNLLGTQTVSDSFNSTSYQTKASSDGAVIGNQVNGFSATGWGMNVISGNSGWTSGIVNTGNNTNISVSNSMSVNVVP
jgi:hypothetical protein